MEQQQIKTTTLRNLWNKKVFTAISKLRKNSSGYYFVTLLNGKSANNMYFGKRTSQLVDGSFKEGDDLIQNGFLLDAQVVETKNAQNETRYKLSKSMGDYSSVASLEDAFGSSTESEFDYEGFQKQFSVPVAVTQGA